MVIQRRTRSRPDLIIWMNGEQVATWSQTTANVDVLEYHDHWLQSPHCRPLSLALPFLPGNESHRGRHVRNWFENLLPDSSDIRNRIARRFQVRNDARSLLAEIGRDCVGAVQVLPADEAPLPPDLSNASPLTGQQVAKTLRTVTSNGTLNLDDIDPDVFRISVAGAQEKTALLRIDKQWYQPHGSTPTSHLLKLPLGLVGNMRFDLEHSVENEWLCLQLLEQMGFVVPQAEIGTFQDSVSTERALVVERFDRQRISDRQMLRLPQEDFCQATGLHLDMKYEADGGPGVAEITQLLRAGSNSDADVRTFVLAQLAFWVLAAIDGHAKNFSIFLRREGYVLTPLYDVISAWPIIGTAANQLAYQDAKLAMSIGCTRKRYKLQGIATRHWICLSDRTGVEFSEMERLVDRVESAIEQVLPILPDAFPAHVWLSITEGMRAQVVRFREGLQHIE